MKNSVRCTLSAWTLLSLALGSFQLVAEEQPTGVAELDQLMELYRAQVEARVDQNYRLERDQLKQNYLAALKRAQEDSQRAGNLEGVLSFKREIDSYSASSEFSRDANTNEIMRLREVLESGLERLKKNRAANLAPLNKTLLTELEKLVLSITREGRLEDATVTRAVREQIADSMTSTAEVQTTLTGELLLKVDIPNYSEMKVRGSEVWLDHSSGLGAFPGLREDPLPAFVGGESWMPEWNGMQTDRYTLQFALPLDEVAVSVKKTDGRGRIEIVEQPSVGNDFTITIGLHDNASASAYTEFELKW
ncbi:MAG: hypothetical protein AAF357_13755 [Verrucomicrobiota bacterium]